MSLDSPPLCSVRRLFVFSCRVLSCSALTSHPSSSPLCVDSNEELQVLLSDEGIVALNQIVQSHPVVRTHTGGSWAANIRTYVECHLVCMCMSVVWGSVV